MGVGSPGWAGITLPAGITGVTPKRSFAATWAVYTASCVAFGTGIRERVPPMKAGQYVVGSRCGPAPSPFMLIANSVCPSAATATPLGYQAVGISPAT